MKPLVTIIIPTFNNYAYLRPCLESLYTQNPTPGLFKTIVVNNGHEKSCDWINIEGVKVISTGDNFGWEGGLIEGLKHVGTPYVLFCNDDVHFFSATRGWLNYMLQHFRDETVGAVGPTSNVVMGVQQAWANITDIAFPVSYLIGFCVLVRMSALEKAGGVHNDGQGGDDLDMSIRLRDAGYKLICDRGTFVYHHGFKTGTRIYGDDKVKEGWNSFEKTEKTNHYLIRKHGFKKWWETLKGLPLPEGRPTDDKEGEIVRTYVKGERVLDFGCGHNKTDPSYIGVDIVPSGESIDTLNGAKSVADIIGDIAEPLNIPPADTIIARHVLEHTIDPINTLKLWMTSLKPQGRMIVAVPNTDIGNFIIVNPEHVHAFTPSSMRTLMETVGLKVIDIVSGQNGISFIAVADKL